MIRWSSGNPPWAGNPIVEDPRWETWKKTHPLKTSFWVASKIVVVFPQGPDRHLGRQWCYKWPMVGRGPLGWYVNILWFSFARMRPRPPWDTGD